MILIKAKVGQQQQFALMDGIASAAGQVHIRSSKSLSAMFLSSNDGVDAASSFVLELPANPKSS